MSTRFHLAQVNIGRFRAPIDDPIMDGTQVLIESACWPALWKQPSLRTR